MQLGETIATYDLALALRGESGKFVITSPAGETYNVACDANHAIVNFQWSGNGANSQPFLIRKVAEPVSGAGKAVIDTVETSPQAPESKTPFLVSTEGNDQQSSGKDMPMDKPHTETENKSISSLDLLYGMAEPESQQPTVWVCLRSEFQQESAQEVL